MGTADAIDQDGPRTALEAAGLRCTPQRLAVYDELTRADHHPTADEVYRRVKGRIPNISLATVYKALDALESRGLAAKLAAGSGPALYDARSEGHYHLRCLRSGRIQDLPTPFDPDLIAKLDPGLGRRLRDRGFRVTGYRLELVGYFDGVDVEGADRDAEPDPDDS